MWPRGADTLQRVYYLGWVQRELFRGEKLQQGWKVRKGARERNPQGGRGNFGNAIQLGKMACSKSEDKSTQTTKVIDRGLEVDKFWNKKVQRSQLENISKVKIGFI